MERGYKLVSAETTIRNTYRVENAASLDALSAELHGQGWRQVNAIRDSAPPYVISATFEIELASVIDTKG